MAIRQTVKEIRYSADFAASVEAEYGAHSGAMQALKNNSCMLGRWLDDGRAFRMSPSDIVAAFKDGNPQVVLRAAETSLRRTALYAAWDREVFTEGHDGSQR